MFCFFSLSLIQAVNDSAPASPELNGQCTDRVNGFNGHSLPTIPADVSKKRRAPLPPMVASQSVACELQIKDFPELSELNPAGKQVGNDAKPELACCGT